MQRRTESGQGVEERVSVGWQGKGGNDKEEQHCGWWIKEAAKQTSRGSYSLEAGGLFFFCSGWAAFCLIAFQGLLVRGWCGDEMGAGGGKDEGCVMEWREGARDQNWPLK